MRKTFVPLLLALALTGLPGVAAAQMMGRGPMMEMGGGMEGMPELHLLMRAAQLTPDQRSKVHDLIKSNREAIRPIQEQIHALREQLAARLTGTSPVRLDDLLPLQEQIAKLRDQAARQRLETALAIRALLTPDQISRVAEVQQKLQSLHQQIRELVGPPGPEGCPMAGPGGPGCPLMAPAQPAEP